MILGSSSDTYQLSHSFREPLRFIVITVISVMSSTFSDTYGILYMTMDRSVFGDRHVFVMFTVIVETLYISGFLTTMTVMTLMTMVYGHFLGGLSLGRDWWQPTRLTAIRRPGSPASLTRASRLINLPQPSAQLGAAWPARHRWQYVRRQAASGSCSHPYSSPSPSRHRSIFLTAIGD